MRHNGEPSVMYITSVGAPKEEEGLAKNHETHVKGVITLPSFAFGLKREKEEKKRFL